MSRRNRTLLEHISHQWRRIRKYELARTLRHINLQQNRQQKRAAFVRSYVQNSIDSIDRLEGRGKRTKEGYLPQKESKEVIKGSSHHY